MTRHPESIRLYQIRLEEDFRAKEKDLSLEMDINRNGLEVPLVVEKEGENQYVLVEGYRRIYALKFLHKEDADCVVESLSSEEGRIIKRLKTELQTKKKTPYELDKMIQHLSRANYSVKHIASLCNVEEKTIKKYIRGLDVSEEWKKRAEEARVGLQPLTTIYELNISYDIKEFIADKYVNRDIYGYHVNDIKDGLKEKEFKNIPEKKHKEIVDQLIDRRSEGKTVKEVVIENSLETKYTKESHSYMHTIVLICLARIGRIFSNPHYTNYLTNEERSQVTKELQNLNMQVNPPIEWKNFSKENRKSSKVII